MYWPQLQRFWGGGILRNPPRRFQFASRAEELCVFYLTIKDIFFLKSLWISVTRQFGIWIGIGISFLSHFPWPLQSPKWYLKVRNIRAKQVGVLNEVLENIRHGVSSGPRGEICPVTVFPPLSWIPKFSDKLCPLAKPKAQLGSSYIWLISIPLSASPFQLKSHLKYLLTHDNLSIWEVISVHTFICMFYLD